MHFLFVITFVLCANGCGVGNGQGTTGFDKRGGQANISETHRKEILAKRILNDKRLDHVQNKAQELFRSKGGSFNAGSSYPETWIRDFATFVEIALKTESKDTIKDRLLRFLDFQGEDGNIVDGYVHYLDYREQYDYIYSKTAPEYKAHKNTVETDQESSFVMAIARYIRTAGDKEILSVVKNGKTVLQRCEMALDFVRHERFSDKYGLVKGATTIDWTDVQPEHPWGVYLTEDTHWCLDVYDNAMYVMAIDAYLDWIRENGKKYDEWSRLADSIRSKVRKHLWDPERQKFIPHIYLNGSPFASIEGFNEDAIYYFGGTVSAILAGMLNEQEIRTAFETMIEIKKRSGSMTIAITNYPPYPEGSFKNKMVRPYIYVNSADWTWWGGRGIEAMIKTGHLDLAYQEIGPFLDRVIQNDGFYEWYSVLDHTPHGSHGFLGSAGALEKAIVLMKAEASRILQENGGDT